jgi:hypothetical protein
MKRTQIYLTSEQRRRISGRARDAGVSQAEVIRRILDDALDIGDDVTERVAAVDATAGILRDAPDWPEWLASVRGQGADKRLRKLGA